MGPTCMGAGGFLPDGPKLKVSIPLAVLLTSLHSHYSHSGKVQEKALAQKLWDKAEYTTQEQVELR